MKRVILAALALAALVGCTNDVADTSLSSGSVVAQFSATSLISRVVTNSSTTSIWETGDEVGISCENGLQNIKYLAQIGESNTTFKVAVEGNEHLLPRTSEAKYSAYYPYGESVATNGYFTSDVSNQSDLGAIDFVVAKEYMSASESSPSVAFTFDHKLSKVIFSLYPKQTLTSFNVSNISLSGVTTVAHYNYTDGSKYDDTYTVDAIDIVDLEINAENNTVIATAIINPVALATDATLTITLDDNSTCSCAITLSPTAGYTYTFTAGMGYNYITLGDCTIDPWKDSVEGYIGDLLSSDIIYDGSEYEIYSAVGLQAFVNLVNGVNNDAGADYFDTGSGNFNFGTMHLEANAMLMRDIDLSTICGATINGGTSWTPIGVYNSQQYQYAGTFDGGGHEIKGLYIKTTDNKQSLFRYVGAAGVVCNLGVSGSVTNTVTSYPDQEMGGIVAYNYGTIINCYSLVEVTAPITNVGGIAAYNIGSVVNCYNQGDITGYKNIGGIVGQNQGYVGYCYNTGGITPIDSNYTELRDGGVVGYNNYLNTTDDPTVKGSFCLNNTDFSIGQLEANANSGSLNTNVCYREYLISESFATTINNGAATYNDTNKPSILACAWVNESNDYPTLNFGVEPIYLTLDISYNSVSYSINSAKGLRAFAALVNGETKPDCVTSGDDIYFFFSGIDYSDIDGKLTTDIDLSTVCGETSGTSWTPIGNSTNHYTGEFNGGEFEVSGLYINASGSDYQGLFGYTSGATISTLGVLGSVTGRDYVGGVVGYNSISSEITNCYNRVAVSGNQYVGGIAGHNASSTITRCYSASSVNAASDVGGVVGCNVGGSVSCCYYDTDIIGYTPSTAVGNTADVDTDVCGYGTSVMQSSTVLGYLNSGTTDWVITDSYPVLNRE